MPDPTDPRAVAAQPALGYDTDCPECSGTGQRDSGGTHPWGEPAMMMCDCDAPPPAAPTDNTALVERHSNKQRNLIINRCSTDLETIINGHDPEIGNLNNDVWDRLDKMAVEIEAALASREAPPACQQEAVTVAEAGMAALKELANTQMNISLTDWQRISSTIATALRALKGEQK